jgi:hypothetical protein
MAWFHILWVFFSLHFVDNGIFVSRTCSEKVRQILAVTILVIACSKIYARVLYLMNHYFVRIMKITVFRPYLLVYLLMKLLNS